jgi:hypothetical protein
MLIIRSLAFTPLIVTYTLEILPYNIRAKGFTIFNFTISLALIFNQYVNPIALGMPSVRTSRQNIDLVGIRCY